jgi:epoxide hydrolase 4
MSSSPTDPDTPGPVAGEPGPSTGLTDTSAGPSSELREGYADLGEQRLHYVEAGAGPLVVLLHGFPEFWYGWRRQIQPLAAAGFRVVAPDTRGYNLSSRPDGIAPYAADKMADDIRGLIRERGAQSALVVGHDWGGSIAWTLAMNHPEVVDRLAILDAAHPRSLLKGLHHPRQLARVWYFFFFALPDLPERVVRARSFRFFRRYMRDARPPYTPEELSRYVETWSQPGAPAAMINYYRCSVKDKNAEARIRPISAPTLVIFGQRDRYLGPIVRHPARDDVPNLEGVKELDASHWVHHDQAEQVTQLLIDFFNAAGPTSQRAASTT